jgi:DNA-binding GntR family transcriptional regulator
MRWYVASVKRWTPFTHEHGRKPFQAWTGVHQGFGSFFLASAAPAMNIVVRTLSERVFESLRDDIVAGRFGIDMPIRQDALAAALGVSKIPVREALARLEKVGLLSSRTNRGYFVPPMSLAQLDDIYALRLAIEPRAAASAAAVADETARVTAHDAMAALRAAPRGQPAKLAAAARAFHGAMVQSALRPLTSQMVVQLLMLSERYVTAFLPRSAWGPRSCQDSQLLLEAWLERDLARVERRLTRNLEDTVEVLRHHFS